MKSVHKGHLYWPMTLTQTKTYPPLVQPIEAEVAIIGAGISGSICAYWLAKNGLRTVLLERGEIAGGSTLANTGLMQFCNDIMLCDLIEEIGERDAVSFYKGCRDAVGQIGKVAAELEDDSDFRTKKSLYFASTEQDVPKLRREYETLKQHGFDVRYWEPETITEHFPFRKPGAIVTLGDAQLNPFRFVHALIDAAASRYHLAVHEQTDITSHETDEDGIHVLHTSSGSIVRAKHIIYAIGYEREELRRQLIKSTMNRTYVIVTEPQRHEPKLPEYAEYFLWETARPYFYMRITDDGRVIAGGGDEESARLLSEKAAQKHADRLHSVVQSLFPTFDAPAEFEWNATFLGSRDNLPFIGADPGWPGVYYCLVYGGNGTVYSMMGANMLFALITGRDHPLAHIVSLDRPTLQEK
ncbi:NAD(P)/FAD-dependent oxidoreductase [Paenibacillus montanisoli]|uniref:FAD-binding oxidoreductase n=1 Tax=Paenibacillus montanisoli TaxID=2081970 RepID=A0A328U5J7_9BACL|nr:FAD-binding oxidoreductase [Paenibacillus montanisoli]RAP75304.1 FAD-binding oxidoreductase [Paenibacillus montanisoli]